jgi:uncharacterized membrane protein YbhN (UPF0104 family)
MGVERSALRLPSLISSRLWKIGQALLAIALVGFAAWYLWRQWRDASAAHLSLSMNALWLAVASAIVLATYALLVEAWRRVLARYGHTVAYRDAARVWFVSNLGKYVPGKVWQVTAMTTMLAALDVPITAAAGASAVITIANVVAGFALLLVAGGQSLHVVSDKAESAVIISTLILLAALLVAPFTMRVISSAASRLLRREVVIRMPLGAAWISLAGCLVAWLLYGSAFQLLVIAILGRASGVWLSYVAAYTLSYLVGYLVLAAPGGLGPREATLSFLLVSLRLATPAEAAVISIASRLWLTVLEVVPGIAFVLVRRRPWAGPPPVR